MLGGGSMGWGPDIPKQKFHINLKMVILRASEVQGRAPRWPAPTRDDLRIVVFICCRIVDTFWSLFWHGIQKARCVDVRVRSLLGADPLRARRWRYSDKQAKQNRDKESEQKA